MKRFFAVFAAGALAMVIAAPARADGRPIEGSYIVVVKPGHEPDGVAREAGAQPRFVYRSALNGFAAELSDRQVAGLQRNPRVEYVEQDQVASAVATQSMDVYGDPWGLDRIDQRALPLSKTYTYTATASAVRAYVIDTGIYTSHTDFGGRASNVYDAFGGNGQDCNGHGTHVAGTVGATTYGVAKAVRLRGVRVLDCYGNGSYSGIIAGIDWVRANHIKPAVANMSLGGGYSSSINTATANLSSAGVFVAVAAGNENQNACNVSPASTGVAYTTAASDKTDTRASFSNYGSCVDAYAPGVGIKSTWLSGGTRKIDGTSMASPHVAGIGALYKATYGDVSSSTIHSWITNNATGSVIKSNVTGTPNRLVYKAAL